MIISPKIILNNDVESLPFNFRLAQYAATTVPKIIINIAFKD